MQIELICADKQDRLNAKDACCHSEFISESERPNQQIDAETSLA
jgi:hypothetical protein